VRLWDFLYFIGSFAQRCGIFCDICPTGQQTIPPKNTLAEAVPCNGWMFLPFLLYVGFVPVDNLLAKLPDFLANFFFVEKRPAIWQENPGRFCNPKTSSKNPGHFLPFFETYQLRHTRRRSRIPPPAQTQKHKISRRCPTAAALLCPLNISQQHLPIPISWCRNSS
jgi:hypothetical protein